MTVGVAHQPVDIHKGQQPGIQLQGFGFAALARVAYLDFERVIQRMAAQRKAIKVNTVYINILPDIHVVNIHTKRLRQIVATFTRLVT